MAWSGHLQVTTGGAQLRVSQQFADAVQIHASFKQVCGKGVAQRVNAADFGDSGGGASCVIVKLTTSAVLRLRWIASTRKQPVFLLGADSTGAPVQPQLFEQVGSE